MILTERMGILKKAVIIEMEEGQDSPEEDWHPWDLSQNWIKSHARRGLAGCLTNKPPCGTLIQYIYGIT